MSVLDGALSLAAQGFRIHPLRPRDKRPLLKDWPALATTDAEQIRAWFRESPNANAGIACGPGWFVLDVDDGEALEELQKAHGQLPVTRVAQTARGGFHIYLAGQSRNRQNCPLPGLDIRGEGGYVVAPPSIGSDGAPYEWLHESESAPSPEWLLGLLRRPTPALMAPTDLPETPERLRRAAAYLSKLPPAVSGEAGHQRLWRAALTVRRGFGLDDDSALSLLAEAYNPRCEPPWSEQELRHKIADAAKSRAPMGYKLAPVAVAAVEEAPGPRLELIRGGDEGGAPWAQLEKHSASLSSACAVLESDRLRALAIGEGELRWNDLANAPEHAGVTTTKQTILDFQVQAERLIFGTDPKTGDRKIVTFSHETADHAIQREAGRWHYHPVREWLASLAPCDPGAIRMVGSEAMGLTGELDHLLWRRWLIGAVGRAMQPGCQLDSVLTLVAPTGGQRKSSFFRALVPQQDWFSDTHLDIAGLKRNDAYMQLHRVWIYEVPELEAAETDRDRSRTKSFVTTRSDDFRAPYDPRVCPHPRTVALGATTNSLEFLAGAADPAFDRRFWPLRVGRLDVEMLETLRDQLWSEAREAFCAGERYWLDEAEGAMLAELSSRHEDMAVSDSWADVIAPWLAEDRPGPVTTVRLMRDALGLPIRDQSQAAQRRVGALMRGLGYERQRQRDAAGAVARVWRLR